ncbi:hypothetical protein ABKN59_011884 [Abortiporus biennis]
MIFFESLRVIFVFLTLGRYVDCPASLTSHLRFALFISFQDQKGRSSIGGRKAQELNFADYDQASRSPPLLKPSRRMFTLTKLCHVEGPNVCNNISILKRRYGHFQREAHHFKFLS